MRLKLPSGFSPLLFVVAINGCSVLDFDREKNCLNPQAACFRGDLTAPSVQSFSPAQNSVHNNVPLTVTIGFSEQMDATTLTVQGTNGACSGNVQISIDSFATCLTAAITIASAKTLSFQRPESPSMPAIYQVKISGVKDKGGQQMPSTFTLSFTVLLPVPDTGQTTCVWNNAGTWTLDATCSQTYTVGSTTRPFGQDAHYNGATKTLQLTDGNQTVSESLTRVSFARCMAGQTWNGSSCSGATSDFLNYSDALNHCASLNTAAYAGYTDWRLPDFTEMAGYLGNYNNATTLPAGIYNYSGTPGYFISGPVITAFIPGVFGHDINTSQGSNITLTNPVYGALCVRGYKTNTRLLQSRNVLGDDIVTSPLGQISYTKCALSGAGGNLTATSIPLTGASCNTGGSGGPASGDWIVAVEACERLIFAGSSNWRLPNIQELQWMSDPEGPSGQPALKSAYPRLNGYGDLWSSTSSVANPNSSYVLGTLAGTTFALAKSGSGSPTGAHCVTDDPL